MGSVNSKVTIYNLALNACGATGVTNVTDDTQEAKLCNLHYDVTRDQLLRKHNWNFATKYQSLTKLPTNTPGFASTFQLPEDCLKVVRLNRSTYPYRIVGNTLVTNLSSVTLEYIARIADVSLFDPTFVEALSLAMAVKMIYKFNQSSSARDELKSLAKDALKEARTADGQEGTQYLVESDQWLNSRFGAPIEEDIQ